MSNPDVVHACVVAGGPSGTDTHYLRAGRGAPVLLLAGDPTISGALVTGLPRRFRSIAPKLAGTAGPRPSEFIPWLSRFLDALGLTRVSIVVGPCFAAHVLAYSMLEPERVGRLAILLGACGEGWGGELDAGVTDELGKAGVPLFASSFDPRDAAGCERTLAEIASFLDAGEVAQ